MDVHFRGLGGLYGWCLNSPENTPVNNLQRSHLAARFEDAGADGAQSVGAGFAEIEHALEARQVAVWDREPQGLPISKIQEQPHPLDRISGPRRSGLPGKIVPIPWPEQIEPLEVLVDHFSRPQPEDRNPLGSHLPGPFVGNHRHGSRGFPPNRPTSPQAGRARATRVTSSAIGERQMLPIQTIRMQDAYGLKKRYANRRPIPPGPPPGTPVPDSGWKDRSASRRGWVVIGHQ